MRRVKIVTPILKNCLVHHDRFKRHILCLELKTVEKIRCPRKKISVEAARDESYLHLVYLEEKIEGRRSKTYIVADVNASWESKTDKAFTQHKLD